MGGDRAEDALAVGAVTGGIQSALQIGQVDVVPGSGVLPFRLVAHLVRPVGDPGQTGLGLVLDQQRHLRQRRFAQAALGQITDDPVAVRPPGSRRTTGNESEQGEYRQQMTDDHGRRWTSVGWAFV